METWRHTIESVLIDWNIKSDKIKAVIIATEDQFITSALRSKGFTLIPCLIFTLQVKLKKNLLDLYCIN